MLQAPTTPVIEMVINYPNLLGEGPVWDSRQRCICWVDILQGRIHEYRPDSKQHRVVTVNEFIGTVAICQDGNFLAALQDGIALVDRESGAVRRLVHPEGYAPNVRYNDGKCDPAGRFWVGTMALSEKPGSGNLYVIEKDLTYSRAIKGVTISNGMAWSPDHRTFYYIDTPTCEVVAYEYDKHTGTISRPRIVIAIPQKDGYPDGMTIDTEGNVWIAHWEGWQITRWNPATGEKLLSIPLPVARVTSCCFGGDTLEDLYITTARIGLSETQLQEQPLAGALFVMRNAGAQGLKTNEFTTTTR